MGTGQEFTGIRQSVRMIVAAPQQGLHAVPGRTVDQRFVLTGIPFTPIFDFADVRPVSQDVMHRASGKCRNGVPPDSSFGIDLLGHAVKCQVFIRVELKDAADVLGLLGIDLDNSAPFFADVTIAVRSQANEPAFTYPTGQAFADIDRLLFGIEARHVGERPSHHPACRVVLRRLRDADEGNIVFRFQTLDLDEVEEIASCPVDLVNQQPVEFHAVLLAKGDDFAERLPLNGSSTSRFVENSTASMSIIRLSQWQGHIGIQDEVRVNWHRHGPQSNSERAYGREPPLSATYPADAP